MSNSVTCKACGSGATVLIGTVLPSGDRVFKCTERECGAETTVRAKKDTFTREDFEHAARAAGYTVDPLAPSWLLSDPGPGWWDPPNDDGDALRLARHLRMTIADEPSRGGWSVGAVVNGAFAWLAHDEDQRAAIFRTAIAMGRAMTAPEVRPTKAPGLPTPCETTQDQQLETLKTGIAP